MKKIIAVILTVFATVSLFTACSDGGKTQDADVNVIYGEIEKAITVPDFIELTAADIADYIAVDPADLKQMTVKISAEAISADQIVICEAIDSEAAARVETAFKVYLDSVKKSFENYLPSEYAKMEDVEVQRSGNYVYYAVSSELSAIEAVFDKYFK